MRVRDAVEAYSYAILHHTDETQRWYLGRLGKFIRWCENTELHQGRELYLQDITTTELRKYVHYLSTIPSEGRGRTAQKLSSNTIHGHARAVRTFLNWCSQEEGFDSLVSEKITRRMNMPHIDQKVIEIFSDAQIRALFAACKREYSEHIQVRDTAILSVLLDTGIRAAELCSLTLEQMHLDPHDSYIKVFGKGRKEREIGLGIEARRVLHKYVRSYRNYTHTVPASERHVFLSRFSKPLT
jgi:site-specific recombinase XerD